MSPPRYKKRAHGYIFGDFIREPAQGWIFEWALLRGLPLILIFPGLWGPFVFKISIEMEVDNAYIITVY